MPRPREGNHSRPRSICSQAKFFKASPALLPASPQKPPTLCAKLKNKVLIQPLVEGGLLFVSKAGPACLCGTHWALNSFTAFSFLPPPNRSPQPPSFHFLSLCLKSQGLQETQLCFCFLSPGPQLIWSSCSYNYRHICTVQGGGRCVSSLRGWERNGLDLGCSLVLILAATEQWTSWRNQIAGFSPAGLTPDMWKRFASQNCQSRLHLRVTRPRLCLRK